MESLALQLLQGKRQEIANACPHLKILVEDTNQGKLSFDEFVNVLRESKKMADVI